MNTFKTIVGTLINANLVLSEQAGGNPWDGFGGIEWTPQMIEMLGQNIMNTEQYGPWYNTPGMGNVIPGWTISQDVDGGIGSGNVQWQFWADAWGYPVPLSAEHIALYNEQMGGENSVYWIGATALMFAIEYAGAEIDACSGNFTCILTQIYAHFLRGPSGMDAKGWGKLADKGLENFLKNWNALREIIIAEIETEEKPEEDELDDVLDYSSFVPQRDVIYLEK